MIHQECGWIYDYDGNMIGTYEPVGSLYTIPNTDPPQDQNDDPNGDVLLLYGRAFFRTHNGTWKYIGHANDANLGKFDDIKSEKYEEEENINADWDSFVKGAANANL